MKYTFENVKPDVYVLKYKNKDGKEVEREFTRNIKLARTLQRVNALAKVEMVSMLKEQGLTKDDLVVVSKNEKGQVIYDESGLREIEQSCLEIIMQDTIDKIMQEEFGVNFETLMVDMGVNVQEPTEEDSKFVELFVTKLGLIITGREEADPS